jgi:hypothetical protein
MNSVSSHSTAVHEDLPQQRDGAVLRARHDGGHRLHAAREVLLGRHLLDELEGLRAADLGQHLGGSLARRVVGRVEHLAKLAVRGHVVHARKQRDEHRAHGLVGLLQGTRVVGEQLRVLDVLRELEEHVAAVPVPGVVGRERPVGEQAQQLQQLGPG